MLQNLNKVAPALASAVEDDKRELHLFIWRCCTSPGQERVERSTCNEDDIVNVILSTPSNPHMLQNLNRVAPAPARLQVQENEKVESVEEPYTIESPGSPEMLKKILKMVCFKLVKNPNSYASILGLSWALVSCRSLNEANGRGKTKEGEELIHEGS
ncbi:hypothetical protein L6452_01029 [Arctium lappa]|uniref:Uncharacterized protein n=1 Tax=Arctium lappa TaxID=4217 RepID=A0ACB9FGE0_ARCLA|nr:hypothetical protein L6452_01029 [Arctium lappa]